MCGIAGYSGHYPSSTLERMGLAMSHRGPDGAGFFHQPDEGIGLAHRRLAIIDLSHAADQPMHDAESNVVIVFNGEIYNYRELRAELLNAGSVFRTQSDTEVLLRLYLREGEAMLGRLNGIFAFAIWDGRKKELFLARDALGVKPLYFAQTSAGVSFASELKALLPSLSRSGSLDPAALLRYVTFLWCPGEGTPLREVRKLPPGEAMIVSQGRIRRRWQWYRLPAFRPAADLVAADVAVRETTDVLRRAVSRQLVADVPIGAFLSGGLDSSAVVALAREQIPAIRCFTIQADGGGDAGEVEDLPYARRVARHLGVPLDVVQIDPGQMAADIERMVFILDEPLADPASLNVLYISQLARDNGIKVLLSGAGGDDLFTGYRRHQALNYERIWSWLPVELRQAMQSGTAALDQRRPIFRRLAKLFAGAGLNGDHRLTHYFVWNSGMRVGDLLSPQFRESDNNESADRPMLDFLAHLPALSPAIERMLALEQRFFLADHNLTYTDKMSMAAGVEVRVPFLDLELVDFAARVPPHLKQRCRENKWVLKKAMEPFLPRDVIYRPKSGFGAPLRRWMRHDLRELTGDLLSEESLRRRGIFDPGAVQRLIRQNETGEVDAAYCLFSVLCIEVWCRVFLDNFSSLSALSMDAA